jgi:hypothetical protein
LLCLRPCHGLEFQSGCLILNSLRPIPGLRTNVLQPRTTEPLRGRRTLCVSKICDRLASPRPRRRLCSCNALMIRLTQSSTSVITSCSQNRRTVQPDLRSRRKFSRSRRRFRSILALQYGARRSAHRGNRQPCQKSPSMNTTRCALGKTISGLPGRDITLIR